MKIKPLFLFLAIGHFIHAQNVELHSLSNGKMTNWGELYNSETEELFGYYSIYHLENIDKRTSKMEYVLLDKNLNRFANGDFHDPIIKKMYPQKGFYMRGDQPVLLSMYKDYKKGNTYTHKRDLDLDTNILSAPYYEMLGKRKDGMITDRKEVDKVYVEDKTFNRTVKGKGYINYRTEKIGKHNKITDFSFFSKDSVEQWGIEVNGADSKKHWSSYNIISVEDNLLLMNQMRIKKDETRSTSITGIDVTTGNQVFDYQMFSIEDEKKSDYAKRGFNINTMANKHLLLIRPLLKKKKWDVLGFERVILNSKTGEEISKKEFFWEAAQVFLDIDKNGKVEKNYYLLPKEYFLFADGRIGILTEKTKESYNFMANGRIQKSTDFVVLLFNEHFELIQTKTIYKEKTKFASTDYLFRQYVNNETQAYFFYKDYVKDKEVKEKKWMLGIVKITMDGVKHEQIEMSSKEHFLTVGRAKEGYILINEYNKREEYNAIRLEKLN